MIILFFLVQKEQNNQNRWMEKNQFLSFFMAVMCIALKQSTLFLVIISTASGYNMALGC